MATVSPARKGRGGSVVRFILLMMFEMRASVMPDSTRRPPTARLRGVHCRTSVFRNGSCGKAWHIARCTILLNVRAALPLILPCGWSGQGQRGAAWLAMQSNYDLAQAMKRQQQPLRPLDDKAAQPPKIWLDTVRFWWLAPKTERGRLHRATGETGWPSWPHPPSCLPFRGRRSCW